MDGPDLSHLLDGASTEKPSPDVLQGIVRRHRRLQARRARTAATLGLVIALAGLGTGIGLSHQGRTVTAAGPPKPSAGTGKSAASASTTTPPLNMSPSTTTTSPTNHGVGAVASPSKLNLGTAPEGLSWVYGNGSPEAANAPAKSLSGSLSTFGGTSASTVCDIWGCSSYGPFGMLDDADLTQLFTRSNDGVTVRAYTAKWTVRAGLDPSDRRVRDDRPMLGAVGRRIRTELQRGIRLRHGYGQIFWVDGRFNCDLDDHRRLDGRAARVPCRV